jgi:hypothetical protein
VLHLAQVIQMALRDGPNGPTVDRRERLYSQQPQVDGNGVSQPGLAAATSALLAGGFALSRLRRISDRSRN